MRIKFRKRIRFRKRNNYPKRELIGLLVQDKKEETKPDLSQKILIISNSQADKFMRLNMVRFLENVSVKEFYINSAYNIIKKKKQFNIYCLLKEISSNKRK